MTVDERPIRAVFDTSAIFGFTAGSVDAGELLSMIGEEGGVVGLPLSCLAAARSMIKDRDMFDLLVTHVVTEVIASSDDWVALAAMQDVTGLPDAACAMVSAIDSDCDVISTRPTLYLGMAGQAPVIPIPE